MQIKAVNHIGINVKDIAASLDFYIDVLGLKVQKQVRTDDCTITYLLLGGERVELFDYYGRNKSALCQRLAGWLPPHFNRG